MSPRSLSQVLRTSLPYDSKYGEVLVQQLPKGGNKVLSLPVYFICLGLVLTIFVFTTQITKATLPDDIDGHEILLLLPELASVSQVDKIIHVRMPF